jgi:TPR repeat protein
MKNLILIVTAALALSLTPVLAADFQKGRDAANNGDFATALKEFEALAKQGHAGAQNNLAMMYARGDGVPQNFAQAVKWYRRAAEQGYAKAQFNLGWMYHSGDGVPQNFAQAVKWYRRAAEQGYADGQNNLGTMYEFGDGVPRNYAQAVMWYRRAAEQGNTKAKENLAKLDKTGKVPSRIGKSYESEQSLPQDNVRPSILRTTFTKLSLENRKQLQSNLKDLGLYKSSIDGLYGKGTSSALTAYNAEHLGGSDLKKTENAVKLIDAVLALKALPQTEPDIRPDVTYKVASGTGFYVSDEGHIITNQHVIDGCRDMKVHSKGEVLETVKIADDVRNDLALLKISETPSHVFALSDKGAFPLQEIIVAGFPFGDRVSSTLKFTQGIVSSVAGLANDYSQIQIDAALQPGNSGGPILDEYGNVVAVAVAKLSLKKILEDYGVVPENTNFGIKASAVRNLMEGNHVPFKSPNTELISREELSRVATDGTVYLTCWMTTAQIEMMRAKKVFFEDLN